MLLLHKSAPLVGKKNDVSTIPPNDNMDVINVTSSHNCTASGKDFVVSSVPPNGNIDGGNVISSQNCTESGKEIVQAEVRDTHYKLPCNSSPKISIPPDLAPSAQGFSNKNSSAVCTKNKIGSFRHSSRNLKRVARMPAKDRREILKILKKHAREQRARFLAHSNNAKGAARSQGSKTASDTSISSINKD